MTNAPLVEVIDLKKHFPVKNGLIKAVENVSFKIFPKKTLGLVGESGCGKSTTGKLLLRLYEKTSGSIFFENIDIGNLSRNQMHSVRKNMQMIFQDPYSSLNPRMTAEEIIKEPLVIYKIFKRSKQAKEKVHELLSLVGLQPEHANRFPHEFSGGQRQRIGIARSLALNPKFIVCDEPIAALDVSIQAQIVNLLQELQRSMGLTYLFISHDLAMVKHLSDDVAVMYLGQLVEKASKVDLYQNPLHPYTEALLSAIPIPNPELERKRKKIVLTGEVPSLLKPIKGCPFFSRCPKAMPVCKEVMPPEKEIRKDHFVKCHLY